MYGIVKKSRIVYTRSIIFANVTAELPANRRIIGLRVTDWYGKDIQRNIKCKVLKIFIHNTTVSRWDFKIFFVTQQPKFGLDRLIVEVSRSHTIRHTHTNRHTHTHTR